MTSAPRPRRNHTSIASPRSRFSLRVDPNARAVISKLSLSGVLPRLLAEAEVHSARGDFVESASGFLYRDFEVERWQQLVLRFAVRGSEAETLEFHKSLCAAFWTLVRDSPERDEILDSVALEVVTVDEETACLSTRQSS